MAKYKAIKSFSGLVSMRGGEVKDITDTYIANDLLKAGYIEEIKPAEKVKATTKARKTTKREG